MLSYPIDEAVILLQTKLASAQEGVANCEEDLDFLREQITVSLRHLVPGRRYTDIYLLLRRLRLPPQESTIGTSLWGGKRSLRKVVSRSHKIGKERERQYDQKLHLKVPTPRMNDIPLPSRSLRPLTSVYYSASRAGPWIYSCQVLPDKQAVPLSIPCLSTPLHMYHIV